MNCSKITSLSGLNVLSIDCEDWFCGLEIGMEDWHRFESRIEKSLFKLLKLLEGCKTRATFFILGYLVEKFPHLVEEIARRDHEIGSHGYSHQFVYRQSPDEFRRDLEKSIEILDDAALLVNPEKEEEIAEGIKQVLTDKRLREELIKKGFERVKRFSWEKTARKTLEIYKSVGGVKNKAK